MRRFLEQYSLDFARRVSRDQGRNHKERWTVSRRESRGEAAKKETK